MASPRPLEGKLAIVTGASRGIGKAIARNLASKGANLVINYTSARSQPLAEAVVAELVKDHSIKALSVRADVAAEPGDAAGGGGAAAIVAQAQAYFAPAGAPFQIDIVVNNAGVAKNNRIADITGAEFTETFRVNVLGPLRMVQAAQPFLPPAGSRAGRIVNLSSVSSSTGFVGQSVYGGSKAAVEAMTRTWARELAEHATVNAINPGPVEGPMYAANPPEVLLDIRGWIEHAPLMKPRPGVDSDDVVAATRDPLSGGGRPGYTSEIAGIVAMLCSPDAAWCTGQVVSANGGMIMQH